MNFGFQNPFMNNSLLLQDREDTTTKILARVISFLPAIKESHKESKETAKMKVEKKTPLFYTESIFKAKEYDPL